MDVGVFLTFPGSSEFGQLSTSTGCGSDIESARVFSVHNCDVPYQQLPYKRHGFGVAPSGHLPSRNVRPAGCFVVGTPADTRS